MATFIVLLGMPVKDTSSKVIGSPTRPNLIQVSQGDVLAMFSKVNVWVELGLFVQLGQVTTQIDICTLLAQERFTK